LKARRRRAELLRMVFKVDVEVCARRGEVLHPLLRSNQSIEISLEEPRKLHRAQPPDHPPPG